MATCAEISSYKRALLDGQIIDAIRCVFVDSMGDGVFVSLFMVPLGIALYFMTGSIAVPAAVVIIGGVVFMASMPAWGANAVLFAIVVGLAVVAFIGMMRLRRE